MAYSVSIKNASKQFSKVERVSLKDTSLAIKIDDLTKNEKYVDIEVDAFVVLAVHNDKSSTPDYEVIQLIDIEGTRYVTGSQSFINTFMNIAEEMLDDSYDENDNGFEAGCGFTIRVFRKPSKNYAGKDFLTCSLLA